MAARLTTFLDTLWVMAPEVPSQWCVPPESSGLRVYARVFFNLRLILKIYRCPRILPTLTLEKKLLPYPTLSNRLGSSRCYISRSPLRSQNSETNLGVISKERLNENLRFAHPDWAHLTTIALTQVTVSFWRHDRVFILCRLGSRDLY